MTSQPFRYRGYRFPSAIISHAVWLYYGFVLSFRDVEDLLAERGITVTYEAILLWCRTFRLTYASLLSRRRGRSGRHLGSGRALREDPGCTSSISWRSAPSGRKTAIVLDILVQSRSQSSGGHTVLPEAVETPRPSSLAG